MDQKERDCQKEYDIGGNDEEDTVCPTATIQPTNVNPQHSVQMTKSILNDCRNLPPLATPDHEIELVETMSGKGSITGVAGHSHVKPITICLVLLSMWVMVVLIMHLDKKVIFSL